MWMQVDLSRTRVCVCVGWIRFENVAACFPALQEADPALLQEAHGQVLEFLRSSQQVRV